MWGVAVADYPLTGYNQIYISTNSGATWTPTGAPSANWASVASSADGCRLVAVIKTDEYGNPGRIYTWQTTPAPALKISSSGSNFLISWIIPSVNFVLQQNPDLAATNWTDVAIIPTLNLTNLEYQVTIPTPAGTMFYRLESQ